MALAAIVLGQWGVQRHFTAIGEVRSFGDNLYAALQLFGFELSVDPPIPWQLQTARFLAPAVAAYVVLGAVGAIFREQFQLLRARWKRGHVVVCGLGERGLRLAKGFNERGDQVVVIERNEDAGGIDECLEDGIVVLVGDATDDEVLRRARVAKARYLIAVGSDDGVNAQVAADAGRLAREAEGKLDAFSHLVDMRLCNLLREQEQRRTSDSFRLRFFNVFESGARAWLRDRPPFDHDSVGSSHPPHLVVVGVGDMGASLVVGAARQWLTLCPGAALRPRADRRIQITLVDQGADHKREWLLARHPLLKTFCDLVACSIDVSSPEFETGAFLFENGRCTATAVYVCFDDDVAGLKVALALLQRVEREGVPIIVRMRDGAGLTALLREQRRSSALQQFSVLEETCTPEHLLGETDNEILARAIHEDYVRDQVARGNTPEVNPAMVDWDDLPEGLKESNRRQADHARVKLRAIGYDIRRLTDGDAEPPAFSADDVELMAEMEHDRWMAERLFEGWTYDPGEKDLDRKTSPHLVPWDELSDDVKEFDRNAVRGLPAFLATAGFAIVVPVETEEA